MTSGRRMGITFGGGLDIFCTFCSKNGTTYRLSFTDFVATLLRVDTILAIVRAKVLRLTGD